jgi:hypothetical protein
VCTQTFEAKPLSWCSVNNKRPPSIADEAAAAAAAKNEKLFLIYHKSLPLKAFSPLSLLCAHNVAAAAAGSHLNKRRTLMWLFGVQ